MKIEIDALRAVAAMHKVPTSDVTAAVVDALNTAYATAHKGTEDVITVDDAGEIWAVSPDGSRSEPTGFGRIAVTAMRQGVVSWVRDQERRAVVGVWASREGKPFTGQVLGPGKGGEIRMRIDGTNAVLPAGEQIPGEELAAGQQVTVLVLAANADDNQRVKLTVSRRQPALITALLEAACPVLSTDQVSISSIAREPGVRTKVALTAADGSVDVVSLVVGPGGFRMGEVRDAMGAERLDFVVRSDDPGTYAAAALTPARGVVGVVDETGRNVTARVPVDQLELATGAGGINVRLAQRLTGTKIRIVPV